MSSRAISLSEIGKISSPIIKEKRYYVQVMPCGGYSDVLPCYGISVTQVDQRDTNAFSKAVQPNTRIIFTETPTNPMMDLTDLQATAALAHAAGALAITDNSFASSYNQRPLALGYDLVVHSATKYLNGHADVTAGVLIELPEAALEGDAGLGPAGLHQPQPFSEASNEVGQLGQALRPGMPFADLYNLDAQSNRHC